MTHNHGEWLMPLSQWENLEKSTSTRKKRVTFLQRDISALYENTHAQSADQKLLLTYNPHYLVCLKHTSCNSPLLLFIHSDFQYTAPPSTFRNTDTERTILHVHWSGEACYDFDPICPTVLRKNSKTCVKLYTGWCLLHCVFVSSSELQWVMSLLEWRAAVKDCKTNSIKLAQGNKMSLCMHNLCTRL